jgi:hypothetical protein
VVGDTLTAIEAPVGAVFSGLEVLVEQPYSNMRAIRLMANKDRGARSAKARVKAEFSQVSMLGFSSLKTFPGGWEAALSHVQVTNTLWCLKLRGDVASQTVPKESEKR